MQIGFAVCAVRIGFQSDCLVENTQRWSVSVEQIQNSKHKALSAIDRAGKNKTGDK